MPLTINTLRSTVKVKKRRRESSLHQSAQPVRPSMDYAMPAAQVTGEGDAPPSQTATENSGASAGRGYTSPKSADPRKVAERVYELMRQEAILDRMRKGF